MKNVQDECRNAFNTFSFRSADVCAKVEGENAGTIWLLVKKTNLNKTCLLQFIEIDIFTQ